MPAPSVLVDFRVAGLEDVHRAVGSVQQSLDRLARSSATSAQKSARERGTAEQNIAREVERTTRAITRTKEQAARTEARAHDQAARAEQRAIDQSLRAVERAEAQKTRAVESEATKRTKALERAAATEARIAEQTARTHERHSRAMASKGSNMVMAGVGSVMGAAGTIAGTVAAVSGGFTIVDAIGANNRREALSGKIVRTAAENPNKLTKSQVTSLARMLQHTRGASVDDTLAGLDLFQQASGKLDMGAAMLDEFAGLSAATGASVQDIGATAGELSNHVDAKGASRVLRGWGAQGKANAIDFQQFAGFSSRLIGAAQSYGGNAEHDLIGQGALAQIARMNGAASARDSMTGVERIATDLAANSDRIQATTGVNVWQPGSSKTKLASADETIMKMVARTHGDLSKLSHAGIGLEGRPILNGFVNAYTGAGGGKAGEAAMRAMYAKASTGTISDDEIEAAVKDKLSENETKLAEATEKVRDAFAQFAPLATKMADEFAEVAPSIASAINSLVDHPFAGLGAIVAASITAEIAKAALGAAIEQAILAAMGKRGAAGVAGEVGGGLLGGAAKGGLLGTVLGLAGTTAVAVGGAAALTYGGVKGIEALDEGGYMPKSYYTKQAKDLDAPEADRKAYAVRELAGFGGQIGNPFGTTPQVPPGAPLGTLDTRTGVVTPAKAQEGVDRLGKGADSAASAADRLSEAADKAASAIERLSNAGSGSLGPVGR